MKRAIGQQGVALTEFAIILPIILILVFSLWEFGRVFDAWLVVTNAAREGARYAVALDDTNEVRQKVQEYISNGYGSRIGLAGDIQSYNITVNDPGSGPVSVTVTADVKIYAPLEFVGITGPIRVTGYAVMRQ